MGDEEWTFVPQRKGSKHTKHKKQHNNRKGKHTVSGLYGASVHNNIDDDTEEHENSTSTDEQKMIERERIKDNVLECMHALESQIQMGSGLFAHRLISSLAAASSTTNNKNELKTNTTTKDDRSIDALHIREIVAYGIGNFAKGNYQAPILQLACLLLIRRRAALAKQHSTNMIDTNHQPTTTTTSDATTITTTDSFEYDQARVPIYYYEPCILPMEKELLESIFHVLVLTSNEFGKRSLESMRQEYKEQQRQQQSSINNAVPSSDTSIAAVSDSSALGTECLHTILFYMPHCPMQLYSNVLWAHWDHIFPRQQQKCTKEDENSSNNSIIVFGNSFHAYDERTISSEKRMNPTNGLYRVIPFVNETIVSVQPSDCRGEGAVDALRYLDNAFNDCNVMSFSYNGDDDEAGCIEKKIMPERPKEWFASDDPDNNGELI